MNSNAATDSKGFQNPGYDTNPSSNSSSVDVERYPVKGGKDSAQVDAVHDAVFGEIDGDGPNYRAVSGATGARQRAGPGQSSTNLGQLHRPLRPLRH